MRGRQGRLVERGAGGRKSERPGAPFVRLVRKWKTWRLEHFREQPGHHKPDGEGRGVNSTNGSRSLFPAHTGFGGAHFAHRAVSSDRKPSARPSTTEHFAHRIPSWLSILLSASWIVHSASLRLCTLWATCVFTDTLAIARPVLTDFVLPGASWSFLELRRKLGVGFERRKLHARRFAHEKISLCVIGLRLSARLRPQNDTLYHNLGCGLSMETW